MPIRVEHAPPAGMVALAGALSGMGRGAEGELEARRQAGRLAVQLDAQKTRQTQQLGAQRAMQMRQIEAQADRQKEAADTAYQRTALAAGLQGKIQEQQFDNQLEKMKEGARIAAEQWEYKYTARQRQDIARFNNARQMITRNINFSPEEKRTAIRAIDLQQAGVTPSMVPSERQYKEGRAPGDEFQDQGGNWHMVQPDGSSKMTLRWDQGPEAAKMKYEAELGKSNADAMAGIEKEMRAARLKFATTAIPIYGKDEKGARTKIGEREPTMGDVNARMNELYGNIRQQMDPSQQQQPPLEIEGTLGGALRQPEQVEAPPQEPPGAPRKLIGWSRNMGVSIDSSGGFINTARDFLNEVNKRKQAGERIPQEMRPAIQEANAILKRGE